MDARIGSLPGHGGPRLATGAALTAALVMLGSFAGAAAQATSITLAPHRAVYDLEMSAARSNSNVVAAQGTMEYRWSDVCDGWALSHSAKMDLAYTNGRSMTFGWKLTSWESKDSDAYRFFIRRFENGEETENLRGRASLPVAGKAGDARFTLPEERSLDLPAGTLFPTAHTVDVLERFAAGDTVLWHSVFDGSGDDGLFEISSINAGEIAAGEDLPESADTGLLEGQKSWTAFFAFFDPGEQDAEPNHEQRLRVFANGVVSEMTLDYGSFVLKGTAETLESLPAPDCE